MEYCLKWAVQLSMAAFRVIITLIGPTVFLHISLGMVGSSLVVIGEWELLKLNKLLAKGRQLEPSSSIFHPNMVE